MNTKFKVYDVVKLNKDISTTLVKDITGTIVEIMDSNDSTIELKIKWDNPIDYEEIIFEYDDLDVISQHPIPSFKVGDQVELKSITTFGLDLMDYHDLSHYLTENQHTVMDEYSGTIKYIHDKINDNHDYYTGFTHGMVIEWDGININDLVLDWYNPYMLHVIKSNPVVSNNTPTTKSKKIDFMNITKNLVGSY